MREKEGEKRREGGREGGRENEHPIKGWACIGMYVC